MSRIPKTTPTTVIHAPWWAESETVTVKTFIGAYDLARIQSAGLLVKDSALQPLATSNMEMRLHEATLTKLEVGVQSWTFCYDAEDGGGPIPLNREALAQLSQEDVAFIFDELNAAWEAWKKPVPLPPASMNGEDAKAAARFSQGNEDPAVGHAKRPHGAAGRS